MRRITYLEAARARAPQPRQHPLRLERKQAQADGPTGGMNSGPQRPRCLRPIHGAGMDLTCL
jgi:hypothetical protein